MCMNFIFAQSKRINRTLERARPYCRVCSDRIHKLNPPMSSPLFACKPQVPSWLFLSRKSLKGRVHIWKFGNGMETLVILYFFFFFSPLRRCSSCFQCAMVASDGIDDFTFLTH